MTRATYSCDGELGACPHGNSPNCRDMCGLGAEDTSHDNECPECSGYGTFHQEGCPLDGLPEYWEMSTVDRHDDFYDPYDDVCEACDKPGGSHTNDCPCNGDEYLRQSIDYCIDCGEAKHHGRTCGEAKSSQENDFPF